MLIYEKEHILICMHLSDSKILIAAVIAKRMSRQ